MRRTHGASRTREYSVWNTMKDRCHNSNSPGYAGYGGRGIQVCPEWRLSFIQFMADMGPRVPGMTIERIDNDGNYEKGNCRWAAASEQASNRRNTYRVTVFNGEKKTVKECAAESGLKVGTIRARIRCGWAEADLLQPARS